MNTHLKNGQLSEYGFSCGYVQREKQTPKGDIWMYKEHNTFHVRMHNEWHSFDTLTEARAKFAQLKKAVYEA